MDMDILSVILSGLAGILVITVLMYMVPVTVMPKSNINGILGTMVTPNQSTARLRGVMVHFMMGVLSVIIYGLR